MAQKYRYRVLEQFLDFLEDNMPTAATAIESDSETGLTAGAIVQPMYYGFEESKGGQSPQLWVQYASELQEETTHRSNEVQRSILVVISYSGSSVAAIQKNLLYLADCVDWIIRENCYKIPDVARIEYESARLGIWDENGLEGIIELTLKIKNIVR